MKKLVFLTTIFLVLFYSSCMSTNNSFENNNSSKLIEDELNSTIDKISNYLLERLQMNSRVSLLNISEKELDVSNYIIEGVSSKLVDSGKIIVVARNNLKPIELEQNFILSGAVSDESFIPIGKYLSAEIIITCSIDNRSGKLLFVIKALDVETAQIKADRSIEIVSISSNNFSIGSMPLIEKVNTKRPDWLNNFAPDDEIWGIGLSTLVDSYEIGLDRAISNIVSQISARLKDILLEYNFDYLEEYGYTREIFVSIYVPQITLVTSRNVKIVKRTQTNDGNIWYLVSLNKNYFQEISNNIIYELEEDWLKN